MGNQEAASYKSMEWADSLGYVMWFSDCHEGDLLVYRITSIYGEQLLYALTEALPEITDGDQSYQHSTHSSLRAAKSATALFETRIEENWSHKLPIIPGTKDAFLHVFISRSP